MLQNAGVLYILPCKCASRHSGVPFLDIGTSKSGPRVWCFAHFNLKMCFAPQRRAIFLDRNFKNGSRWGVLYILTYKCASHHSGVQFLDIGTSKSGPRVWCFAHFDLKMCFSRQRRATSAAAALARLLFQHQEPRIIEKTQRFATSLTFRARVASF